MCRTATTVAVLLLGVALAPRMAGASGFGGRVDGTESVTAGSWGATASVTSMVFTSNAFKTSVITNSGTVALSAESYSVTVSKPASGAPTIKVFQCSTAWVSNLCLGGPGTQVGGTLAANSTTTVTSSTALAASATLYLQVQPTAVTASTTVTLSPRVTSPTQLRASVKTNQ